MDRGELSLSHIMTGPARPRRATTFELYAKIIAESELLQPALNEIHKFCFQHWSRGRGTCGTGSGAPDVARIVVISFVMPHFKQQLYFFLVYRARPIL